MPRVVNILQPRFTALAPDDRARPAPDEAWLLRQWGPAGGGEGAATRPCDLLETGPPARSLPGGRREIAAAAADHPG